MQDFWEFPTVSMGLGPIQAIYHARFIKYLENRGLKTTTGGKVWAFLGDGEMDEPESLGSITLASRERLDNLIFVMNCNLQRLDGPVRGNGKIIQELEAIFRGAGWNVIKCIWGSDWDTLIQNDRDGLLVRRMGEITDGQYQKYFVESGAYFRQNFFGTRSPPAENGGASFRRAALTTSAWRTRSHQSARGLQGSNRSHGIPVDRFSQDHQRLRLGRSRRRQEHHPPAEETERR